MFDKVSEMRNSFRGVDAVKFNILTLIVSEVDTIYLRDKRKNKDDICMSVMKKVLSDLNLTVKCLKDNGRDVPDNIHVEINLLESILPKKLTFDEVKQIVFEKDLKDNKTAQIYFKQTYPNQYDGSDVSSAVKCMS